MLRPLLARRGGDPDVVALATELDRAEQGKRSKRRALGGPASMAQPKKPRAAAQRTVRR